MSRLPRPVKKIKIPERKNKYKSYLDSIDKKEKIHMPHLTVSKEELNEKIKEIIDNDSASTVPNDKSLV